MPMHVAAYIEQHPGSPQTIKQHLAAIKMLFDYLVVSQIVPVNPAAPARVRPMSSNVAKRRS
jgi:integrase/recombinase XerD